MWHIVGLSKVLDHRGYWDILFFNFLCTVCDTTIKDYPQGIYCPVMSCWAQELHDDAFFWIPNYSIDVLSYCALVMLIYIHTQRGFILILCRKIIIQYQKWLWNFLNKTKRCKISHQICKRSSVYEFNVLCDWNGIYCYG